jgi:outer membrane lipoprotein-sorting protein
MSSISSGRRTLQRFRATHFARGFVGLFGPVLITAPIGLADEPNSISSTRYYSTAAPPVAYPGPKPILLALADPIDGGHIAPAPMPVAPPAETPHNEADVARIANVPVNPLVPRNPAPTARPSAEIDSIGQALRLVAECQARYAKVRDYTCTFYKRERLDDGHLTSQHIMQMKYRTQPVSVYFKFVKPTTGREAIYVAGKHGGKALVHDVGLGKLLAGTLALDPRGAMAMEDCRHPITDAGIGHLVTQLDERWKAEMSRGETVVAIHSSARVGNRACTLIESTHPLPNPSYLFHKVKVYIDNELGLPIRFEAFDWPKRPGQAPELVEEYTYYNLRLNVDLTDHEFDAANKHYSFGRF